MIEVGVSDIAIYVPPYYLPHEELARARGVSKEKYIITGGYSGLQMWNHGGRLLWDFRKDAINRFEWDQTSKKFTILTSTHQTKETLSILDYSEPGSNGSNSTGPIQRG